MSAARAYVDCTSNGCVAKCRQCDFWFAFREDRQAAWRAVRDHELRAHPGAAQATSNLAKRARGRAA